MVGICRLWKSCKAFIHADMSSEGKQKWLVYNWNVIRALLTIRGRVSLAGHGVGVLVWKEILATCTYHNLTV